MGTKKINKSLKIAKYVLVGFHLLAILWISVHWLVPAFMPIPEMDKIYLMVSTSPVLFTSFLIVLYHYKFKREGGFSKLGLVLLLGFSVVCLGIFVKTYHYLQAPRYMPKEAPTQEDYDSKRIMTL